MIRKVSYKRYRTDDDCVTTDNDLLDIHVYYTALTIFTRSHWLTKAEPLVFQVALASGCHSNYAGRKRWTGQLDSDANRRDSICLLAGRNRPKGLISLDATSSFDTSHCSQ
ncbi:hypothetical protein BaRGS_00022719 [Batillaria attramentaria]|uniref:Uncharacterized protein n=1 Tax=Batillaria attramentaria TaxID=370345 RepID=A0ABD0KGJ6_9CAEN